MMRPFVAALLFVLAFPAGAKTAFLHGETAWPQDGPGPQHQAPRVSFAGPPQQAIRANAQVEVPLHFSIPEGFHINSHTPRQPELIATRLATVAQGGITVRAVDFPPGEDYAFAFDPKTKLSVYSGEFTITAHLRTTPGEHVLNAVLHYQACDNRTCYPPRDLPVSVKLTAQ